MNSDLRLALRQLRKAPGFAVTAVLTLALTIAWKGQRSLDRFERAGCAGAFVYRLPSYPQGPDCAGRVVLAMMATGLVAAWIPARHALAVDPMILRREE